MQPASLSRGSEEIQAEDKHAPFPHLSTSFHDPEGTACSTCPIVPPPASSPSPSPNVDCPISALVSMSSIQCDSSSGSPENTQSEQTEVPSHENSSASRGLSSLLPPSSPSASPDFHCPENNQKYSPFPDSDGISLFELTTNTQKKEEETPSSLSFQLDKDNSSALILDSSEFEEGCPTLPSLSPNPKPPPVCQFASSAQSHDSDGLIHPAVGRISDLTEQSISQQDRPCSHDYDTDPAQTDPSPVQDVIHVKTNYLSLDLGRGEVEGERHADTVQTSEAVVYISDTKSSAGLSPDRPAELGSRLVSEEVCNQTEIDLQVPSCSLYDELSTGTKPEECQREMNGSESESLRSSFVLYEEVPEAYSRTEVEPKNLIMIESLDLVFQTSVDGSESDDGDVDAFFQQLDTEGRAYWAEPIQVSNSTPVPEESVSFEASDGSPGNSLLPRGPAVLDPFSSTGRALCSSSSKTMDNDRTSRHASSDTPSSLTLAPFSSPSTTPDIKPLSRSVSVQMSSSLSSHIVNRKDVPYVTDSKRSLLPSVFPLDTSTPFRAVQSWTDLHIQRNTITKNLSHGVTVSTGAIEMTQRPTLNFSSSPYFPLESNDWHTMSASVDKGLWADEEEEVDRNGNKDEDKLWEGNQKATMACCCSCDHQCTCCSQESYNKQHTLGNMPVSNTTRISLYVFKHIHIET